jgi:pSer/pThr/pTyr-binding forkhead associated (FHA) protein
MRSATIILTLIEKDGDRPSDMALGDSTRIVMDGSRRLVIGRAPMVDVAVDAPSVGRSVVSLEVTSEGVRVMDLGSGGGSALEVDGARTDRPCGLLPDGSVLWIGGVGFRVGISRFT